MTQYCRYCVKACLNDEDLIYCGAKKQQRNRKQCIRVNKCKHFVFNPIDVFDFDKQYKPRQQKEEISIDGQMKFDLRGEHHASKNT